MPNPMEQLPQWEEARSTQADVESNANIGQSAINAEQPDTYPEGIVKPYIPKAGALQDHKPTTEEWLNTIERLNAALRKVQDSMKKSDGSFKYDYDAIARALSPCVRDIIDYRQMLRMNSDEAASMRTFDEQLQIIQTQMDILLDRAISICDRHRIEKYLEGLHRMASTWDSVLKFLWFCCFLISIYGLIFGFKI